MATIAARWQLIADEFGRRVDGVPPGGWERPAPCEGWVARDVVEHLTGWMPGLFFGSAGLSVPVLSSDPVEGWHALDRAVLALLDDPALASLPTQSLAGSMTVEQLVAMTGLPDLLVHTWDLARATGQDEVLNAEECAAFFAGMEPMDEMLRSSGQFAARVAVGPEADAQTKLIAFTGRLP
jgi:uncharacterized protein (TIGR03086 family)